MCIRDSYYPGWRATVNGRPAEIYRVDGALRGLATVAQLAMPGAHGFEIAAVHIEDRPRFPWRGLMLDVSRHWMPLEVVLRNLEAMAAVKLNVFHWHLSDDQGFRVESRLFPWLQGKGSDGHFYTQAEIRRVVAFARDRGIRVIPEFDIPGHSTSSVSYTHLDVYKRQSRDSSRNAFSSVPVRKVVRYHSSTCFFWLSRFVRE